MLLDCLRVALSMWVGCLTNSLHSVQKQRKNKNVLPSSNLATPLRHENFAHNQFWSFVFFSFSCTLPISHCPAALPLSIYCRQHFRFCLQFRRFVRIFFLFVFRSFSFSAFSVTAISLRSFNLDNFRRFFFAAVCCYEINFR